MRSRYLFMVVALVAIIVAVYFAYAQWVAAPIVTPTVSPIGTPVVSDPLVDSLLTASEARAIAKNSDCAKSGTVQDAPFYNSNSKTWWFGLDMDKPGCSPACVVSEDKSAEINWRCTGLLMPSEASAEEAIKQVLAQKYPKYAQTLSVSINKEGGNYARGSVVFEAGAPGGIFLAAKIDGNWQVVHDGNGEIPCALSSYGFPADMLVDCAR